MIGSALSGASAVIGSLAKVQKQLKFATSQALNDTAKDVQRFTVGSLLPSKFTLRAKGNPWQAPGTKLGFNLKFANRDNLTAVIGSQADWLDEQEQGGRKTVTGGHRAAIPSGYWKRREEIMTRQKKPKAILAGRRLPGLSATQRAFLAREGGKLKPGIYVRTGKGRELKILFGLRGNVTIKPRLEFVKQGTAVAESVYNRHFNNRLVAAFATM